MNFFQTYPLDTILSRPKQSTCSRLNEANVLNISIRAYRVLAERRLIRHKLQVTRFTIHNESAPKRLNLRPN